MPFVQGKCESCGGILTVDPSLKAAICPFCGSAYVVQDSINYYNTTIKVDNLFADVVNVSDESSSEGRIKAAEAFMKLGQNDKAEAEYKSVTERTPQNYKGWLGLIKVRSNNYTKRIKSANEIASLENYAKSVKLFASEDIKDTVLQKYEEYVKIEKNKNADEIKKYTDALEKQKLRWSELTDQERQLKDSFDNDQRKIDSITYKINNSTNKAESKKGLVLTGIVILIGIILLYKSIYLSIVLFLVAGIPCFLSIRELSEVAEVNACKRMLPDLLAKQKKTSEELKEIISQKEKLNTGMISNQNELQKYD